LIFPGNHTRYRTVYPFIPTSFIGGHHSSPESSAAPILFPIVLSILSVGRIGVFAKNTWGRLREIEAYHTRVRKFGDVGRWTRQQPKGEGTQLQGYERM
jgi:hypothetical protein